MRICSVQGCERKHTAKGWCHVHYKRMKKHGSLKLNYKTAEERFFENYIPEPMSGCWLWIGATQPNGYGRIRRYGSSVRAHRLSWEIHRGPIPKGTLVCHHCDTPACVNPDHLFVGTQKDNVHDSVKKGRKRGARGERNGTAVLNRQKVREIREKRKQGLIFKAIALQYNVKETCIRKVCNNITWREEVLDGMD